MGSRSYSYDSKMQLSDGAAAYTASGIGQVAAANKILDLGGAQTRSDLGIVGGQARIDAACVVDISAIATVTDGQYRISVMGSNNSNGSNPVCLGCLELGLGTNVPNGSAGAETTGAGSDTGTGRREILFCTEQNDIMFEYVYLYVQVLGTTSKSITFKSFVAILPLE